MSIKLQTFRCGSGYGKGYFDKQQNNSNGTSKKEVDARIKNQMSEARSGIQRRVEVGGIRRRWISLSTLFARLLCPRT